MQFIYKTFYHPQVNKVARQLLKGIKKVVPTNFILPVTGTLTLPIGEQKTIKIAANETCHLAKILYWNGTANFEFTTIFKKLIKEVDVFFDIGANIGYYTILANAMNPKTKIYAFEPARGPYHFLMRNVVLNKVNNTKVEPIALSQQNGEITFYEVVIPKYSYIEHHLTGMSNTENSWQSDSTESYQVKTVKVDEYVTAQNLPSLDLIKIDTEGTEHHILGNALASIKKYLPIIICEVIFNKAEIQEIVDACGYQVYQDTAEGLVHRTTLIEEHKKKERNFFLVHPSKLDKLAAFIIAQ